MASSPDSAKELEHHARALVSIITVTRDCAETIDRTLNSVQALESDEVEYLIIDGQSRDGTQERIGAYPDLVDYFVSEPDAGIYNAMNKGAKAATGKYLLFLNGDDTLSPMAFREAMDLLKRDAPDVLCCACEIVANAEGERVLLRPSVARLPIFNTIPHPTTFVASQLQKSYQFREQFRIAADYDLFFRLWKAGVAFRLSELVIGTHYRGGFSDNRDLTTLETRRIRREHLGFFGYAVSRVVEGLNLVKFRVFERVGLR